jgi:indole-3-glycerol phosphate synthase
MSDFLAQACEAARERVRQHTGTRSLAALRQAAEAQLPPASLADALGGDDCRVVAELKRASPSRGRMATIPDPGSLAGQYAAGGAAAVSVLTEPHWFGGDLSDLAEAVAAVELPAVCKDFVVDAYQVWQARNAGAAGVLLITAALGRGRLAELLTTTAEAGLQALVEVHTAAEAATAVSAHADAGHRHPMVVGVNARDMASLAVDRGRFAAVAGELPDDAVVVAESGVTGAEDARRLAELGADALLVGEHAATAADPAAAVAALVEAGRRQPARL